MSLFACVCAVIVIQLILVDTSIFRKLCDLVWDFETKMSSMRLSGFAVIVG